MKKKLIIGSLILCCMILVTAIGPAFARKLGEEKHPNVILVSEHYNMKTHDKKTELNHAEPYSGLDYKNECLNEEPGDPMQGLIMAPIAIIEAIGENPVIITR